MRWQLTASLSGWKQRLSIDVAEFERLARDGTPAALEHACALCIGDLLEGIGIRDAGFEEWLEAERHRLRRLHEDVLTRFWRRLSRLPCASARRAACSCWIRCARLQAGH